MAYIWKYIKKHPKLLCLNLFGALMFVLVNLGLPTVLSHVIDEALTANRTDRLYVWIAVMGGVIVTGVFGRIVLTYASSKLTTTMIQEIRNDLFDKLQQYSHYEYEQIGISSLVTRITNDSFVLMQFAEQALRMGVITPLMFSTSVVMVVMTNPSLGWFLVMALPLLVAGIVFIAVKSKPLSEKQQKTLDKMNQYVRENLTGLRVIRAFAREEYQEGRFEEQNKRYATTSDSLFKLMGVGEPMFVELLIVMIVLIVWFALEPIRTGDLQIGSLVAFVEYSFHSLFSFLMFAILFTMYPRTAVSANRLQEVMDMPISIDPNELGVTQSETKGYLEFENVTFAYPGETENPVLHNISFQTKPGEMIAFIGSTGSGKSSLVQLIPRFYDVTLGKILIDGIDVRDYNLKALREKIGFIPQKSLLFTGTIGENLRYGKEDATLAELDVASDVSQAKDFIEKTEHQYESFLSEGGSNLSGGQKQRLSIARAVVKRPDVYIFDDSFSALDYKTDAELRRRLKEVTKEATVLIVAQRVGTIMNADRIIVLDKGEIVGQGTHEELMQTNDIYRDIANSQLNADKTWNEDV